MSVLISSSPPISSLFLDLYQEHSIKNRNTSDGEICVTPPRVIKPAPLPDKSFRPTLSFVRRKKSVVFADSMGLPLTQVKMLKVEELEPAPPPQRPRLASRPSTPLHSSSISLSPGLRLNFAQPISRLNYLDTIRRNRVGLENVLVDKFTLTGTILIHNICFEKTVKVRYTRDYWLTHQEVVSNYCAPVAGDIDKFSFSLTLPSTLPPGARVELCVCATLGDQEFWDSNFDRNYQIECLLMPPKSRGLHDLINGGIHLMPRVSLEEDSSAGIYY